MLWHEILAASAQSWPPFALVAGLLMIGALAAEDGLFEAAGAAVARAGLRPRALLLALLALVAGVTAILNLDTSVVFMTPVLVHAARRSGTSERPFLYGSVFMANSASLLLPGSRAEGRASASPLPPVSRRQAARHRRSSGRASSSDWDRSAERR